MEDQFICTRYREIFQETAGESQGEDLNVNSLLMHY